MAATKSSGMNTDVQLRRNEETLTTLQHQPRLASLLAENVGDSESGLDVGDSESGLNVRDSESGFKHLQTDSTPRYEAEKAFIPDMFVSFVSQKPRLNVHYEVMKLESEVWLRQ